MTGPIAHAKLSASGSATWLNCPGSANAQEGMMDFSSVFAQEGTVAHALGELCLTTGNKAETYLGQYVATDEGITDICVDDEMVNYINGYAEYVDGLGRHQHIEQRVDYSPWAVPESFGTSDAIVIDKAVMHVVDLKYGRGVQVNATQNSQGMLYALGSYNDFGFMYPQVKDVLIHIYQPRIGHYDEWSIPVTQLLEWGEDVVKPAALATQAPDAPRIPGEKQCTWCKFRPHCKELAEYNMKLAHEEFDDLSDLDKPLKLKPVESMSVAQLSMLLAHVNGIKNWAASIESLALGLLKEGTAVPGYKMVEGRSNRAYRDPEEAEKWLVKNIDNDKLYTQNMLSLSKVEKLVSKKMKPEFSKLVYKPPGKPSLALESDKREALVAGEADTQSAVADFDDIEV